MKMHVVKISAMIVLMAATTVSADVKIKSLITTNILGAGATETRRTEYFRKDRTYSESLSNATSGLMAKLNKPAQKVISVTRLDKGVIWSINESEKGYVETPLDTINAKLQGNNFKSVRSPLLGISTEPDDYKWRLTVTKIEEPMRIGWADCRGVMAKAIGVNRNNEDDKILITYEQWFADKIPGGAVYDDYQNGMKKALGSDNFAEQRQIANMLGVLGEQFEPIFDSVKAFDGAPIKLVFKVEKSTLFGFTEAQYDRGLTDPDNQQMIRLNNMIGGKPQKTENGMFESFSITADVSKIEETGLDDSFYEIPADYTLKQPSEK
jgi:hypothetical protein